MSRKLRIAVGVMVAFALAAAREVAYAQDAEPAGSAPAPAPPYTLEIDSDAPDVISFGALAPRIASDLGAPVVRAGAAAPSRAAIAIRYREGQLVVRATYPGGRALERSMKPEGDDAAVQREAVLLAGNLARDEARELLDALAARQIAPAAEPASAPAAAPVPTPAPADDGWVPVSASLFYPIATNLGRPDVGVAFDFSLLYGRVGAVDGLQFGTGVTAASRTVHGVQIGAFGNVAVGRVFGVQLGGGGNVAGDGVSGAQIGVVNVARGGARGAQISGGTNVVTREARGAQIAPVNVAEQIEGAQIGVVNVARKVRGAQIGVINVADEVDGAALGVVSVSRDGVHPIAWGSNLAYMNAGVKFSTKYLYTVVAMHYGTLETGLDNSYGSTGVVGGRLPLPAGFDVELQGAVTSTILRPNERPQKTNLWLSPELVVGYSFAPHLRLFAGGGARIPAIVDLGRRVTRPEALAGVQF